MSHESAETYQQLMPPAPASRSVRLSEEQAVVLIEALTPVIEYLWPWELGHYRKTPKEQRAGHLFEHVMRLKALVNAVKHQVVGEDSPCGVCPHCLGGDGRYVLDNQSWGYCRLCHARWHLGPFKEGDSLWPIEKGRSAQLIHQLFKEARRESD